jgi:transcriptional regulator with XRE-family HTH domain
MSELFRHRIRRLRLERKFTLRDVARRTGLSHGYIDLVERGSRPIPVPEYVLRLALALEVDPVELVLCATLEELRDTVAPVVTTFRLDPDAWSLEVRRPDGTLLARTNASGSAEERLFRPEGQRPPEVREAIERVAEDVRQLVEG